MCKDTYLTVGKHKVQKDARVPNTPGKNPPKPVDNPRPTKIIPQGK